MSDRLEIYVSDLFCTDLMIFSDGEDYELRINNVITLVGTYKVVLAEFDHLAADLERREELYYYERIKEKRKLYGGS